MTHGKARGLWLLLGTLLFNLLFWNEILGINLLLFSVGIIALVFYLYPHIRSIRAAWWVAAGSLLGALATVLFNNSVAKLATITSIMLFNGYAMFPQAKSLISAFAATVSNLVGGFMLGMFKFYERPKDLDNPEPQEGDTPPPLAKWKRQAKLVIIPIIIALTFYTIFSAANPVFAKMVRHINEAVIDFLERIFSGWSIERISFALLGAYLVSVMLYHLLPDFFKKVEAGLSTKARERENERSFIRFVGLSGIKDETLVGIITLVMVNLLILSVNLIDITTLWFNYQFEDGMNLSSLVHVGTYWLIFSILLSMGILMYLFRGNQNFNTGNGTLKSLAYVWVVQNAIMVVSVVLRNHHYIDKHGLTYKRIGVYTFLLMTVLGLATLVFKIAQRRSNFYLWKTNSWLAYALLVVAGFWNWDYHIAKFNITHIKNETLPNFEPGNEHRYSSSDDVDLPYLLSLSDKALPAFLEHPHFEEEYHVGSVGTLKSIVRDRYYNMESKHINRTWLSWNLAEDQTLEQLSEYYTGY